jgi:N-acetylneuraminic acid mutarotase
MKRILSILLFFILILSCYSFEICDNFTERTVFANQDAPSVRGEHAMVFDSVNNKTILHGGFNMEELITLDDTWVFDSSSNTWTKKTSTIKPPPMNGHEMVFDSINEKIILYGGVQTWFYDYPTNVWTQVFPNENPHERNFHAMAFDQISGKVYLFGGFSEGDIDDAFWSYDYSTNIWVELTCTTKPPSRYGHNLVYDANNQQLLLYGGNSFEGLRTDFWSYNSTTNNWTELTSATQPSGRKWSGMSYDSLNQQIILFGGTNELGTMFDDTWSFDTSSNQWNEKQPNITPSGRHNIKMVYDSSIQKTILFGGYVNGLQSSSDTWLYDYNENLWSNVTASTNGSTPIPTTATFTSFAMLGILIIIFGVIKIARSNHSRKKT